MKIGLMNNPAKPVIDEAAACGKAGFDFLDLTIEGPQADTVDIDRLRAVLDTYGLSVTGHTDPCLPYAYPLQDVRDACFQELERCAGIFSALRAEVMNIHPCYYCPPAMKKDLIAFNIEALKPIAEMAKSHNLTLVLENYIAPFDQVATFERILAEVPGLQLHLDFGHTNIGRDGYDQFCRKLGSLIGHVHFSDNRSRTDDHMPLGVGTINWKQAVQALKSTGYDNTITLEIFCSDPLVQYGYLEMSRKMIAGLWGK